MTLPRLVPSLLLLAASLCGARNAAERVLIADFERDAAALASQNRKIVITRNADAAVGKGAARVDWRDGEPGWSRGLRVKLPGTGVPFDALSLWLRADGGPYAAVELRVRHRKKGNYRLPLIVPPVWRRFVLPLRAFRPWGIKESLARENIAELMFRRIGWTGRFLVDHVEWIAGDAAVAPAEPVRMSVDAARVTGDCDGFWAGIGDDPARPFDPDVQKVLAREQVFRHVRVHNLFTDGAAAWERDKPFGCCIYSEGPDGTPHYDWTRLDAMLDSFRKLGLRPILETDFMPADLAAGTARLRRAAKPGDAELLVESAEGLPAKGKATLGARDAIRYQAIRHTQHGDLLVGIPTGRKDPRRVDSPAPPGTRVTTALRNYGGGLRCSPRDYAQWQELVRRTVAHCIERYGRDEVRRWHWEVWNEPDLWWLYWHPAPDNPRKPDLAGLCKLYGHAVAGARAADPAARVGGPAIAGFTDFLSGFLDHVAASRVPLDFISWHSYNTAPFQMATLQEVGAMVRKHPALRRCEWQINEIGYLAGPMAYNRSGALSLIKLVDVLKTLRQSGDAPRTLLVYWGLRSCGGSAFEKLGKYSHGLLIPYGDRLVGKPILTSYRLLARLGPKWLDTSGSGLGAVVHAVATLEPQSRRVAVLAYHMDDYDIDGHGADSALPPRQVRITVRSLAAPAYRVSHHRFDAGHSSTFDAWKRAGKPAKGQLAANPSLLDAIARHDRLEPMAPSRVVPAEKGVVVLETTLPGASASLWLLQPAR